jgi:hypothetical protein
MTTMMTMTMMVVATTDPFRERPDARGWQHFGPNNKIIDFELYLEGAKDMLCAADYINMVPT